MNILGINNGWHDSSAALLVDGELALLIEGDRVSRVKQAMRIDPAIAIETCLEVAGMTLDDIDVVAFGWDDPYVVDNFFAEGWDAWDAPLTPGRLLPLDRFPRKRDPEMVHVRHHEAHAASGMYLSGFERSAVLVVDGRGECQATSLLAGTPAGLELLKEWPIADSLGNAYGHAANWVGFSFWGPGKLMGLAPYGRPGPNDLVDLLPDGYRFIGGKVEGREGVSRQEREHIDLLTAWFRSKYPFSKGDPDDIMAHADLAATVQHVFEESMFHLARLARERVGGDTLVIAGGAGLNCSFNGRLAQSGLFDEVFVPPVTHDAGVGLGAALAVHRRRDPNRPVAPRLPHAYWGYEPSAAQIEDAVRGSGFVSLLLEEEDLLELVARRLSEGAVVGWYQGRAEIGQRALGARSMLGDPRDRRNLVRVNKVKGREVWRPLAPSVLEEHAHEFFDGPHPVLADFMLAAMPVRAEARSRIPATVHVDGSARPQFVRRATNPRYWSLIDAFRRRTGVPVVMNTSFNLAGEPIVHTPQDAVRSFARSEMDLLVLGDHVVQKPIR